jgi:hypothetical protein
VLPEQFQPVPTVETSVRPAGSVSVAVTVVEVALALAALLTVTV